MLLFYIFITIIGLAVGSFIGMAVYRIPKMLYFNWFVQCYEFLNLKPKFQKTPSLDLNLWLPRSHCPNCQQKIPVLDNIPIISYLILKAKCRNCKQKISIKYLVTESITAFCSLIIAIKFGIDLKLLFGLLIVWTLVLQSVIDFQETLIPDEITLPMLWLGIFINNFNIFVSLQDSVIGAIFGYLIFWILFWIFKIITGKDGIGYGDFKLLAMLGAWFGYKNLPLIIFVSSTIGSLIGGGLILMKKQDRNSQMPFGPYLALGGFGAMLCGDVVTAWLWQ
jgi:leader peptidase (prepilin peptidase) / N-methyltransferase